MINILTFKNFHPTIVNQFKMGGLSSAKKARKQLGLGPTASLERSKKRRKHYEEKSAKIREKSDKRWAELPEWKVDQLRAINKKNQDAQERKNNSAKKWPESWLQITKEHKGLERKYKEHSLHLIDVSHHEKRIDWMISKSAPLLFSHSRLIEIEELERLRKAGKLKDVKFDKGRYRQMMKDIGKWNNTATRPTPGPVPRRKPLPSGVTLPSAKPQKQSSCCSLM